MYLHYLLALVALLTTKLCAAASVPVVSIVFAKYKTPPGWTRYEKSRLSPPNVNAVHTSSRIPFAYRAYIQNRAGFSYSLDGLLGSGRYSVTFGLLVKAPCFVGSRVFRFSIGTQVTRDIDIVKEAGCLVAHDVTIPVVIAPGEKFIIKASHVSGSFGPSIANLRVYTLGSQPSVPNSPLPQQSSPASTPGNGILSSAKVVFGRKKGPLSDNYSLFSRDSLTPRWASLKKGKGKEILYRDHIRNRPSLEYAESLKNGAYDVRLGFLESIKGKCHKDGRVLVVSVGDVLVGDIDVYAAAGCQSPYNVWVRNVVVTSGKLVIKITGKKGPAMISNFEVQPTGFVSNPPSITIPASPVSTQTRTPLPTPSTSSQSVPLKSASPAASKSALPTPTKSTQPVPSPQPDPRKIDIKINAGKEGLVAGTKAKFYGGQVAGVPSGIPAFFFKSHVIGKDFTYSFDVPPGAYDITLGFIETYPKNCMTGGRVFSVYVNDAIQLESYDLFEDVGCYRAKLVTLKEMTVGAVDTKPLTIRFLAISNFALVAYIHIKASVIVCIPDSTTGSLSDDHAAHAVPGSYPPQLNKNSPLSYVDADGDGYYTVQIDGRDSHTHFFDADRNIIGKLKEFTWSLVETGQIISRQQIFSYKFPLGTTRLKLVVLDNSCSSDEAETTVTVTGKVQPGQYCYFYQGALPLLSPGTLLSSASAMTPIYAEQYSSLNTDFSSVPVSGSEFTARCVFFYEYIESSKIVSISADASESGSVKVFKGTDIILDTTTFASAETLLATGLTAFEVIYVRTDTSVKPKLAFKVDGSVPNNNLVSHDQTTILPILFGISPNEGSLTGGNTVTFTGRGLYQPLKVYFGTIPAKVAPNGAWQGQFSANAPLVSSAGVVDVYVKSAGGITSNSVKYTYGQTQCENPAFTHKKLFVQNGTNKKDVDFLNLPTSAVLGPDRRIYMGTLGATVQVLGYNPITLQATTHCFSEQVRDPKYINTNNVPAKREILGIAFNPMEKAVLPYVSTSTIYWNKQERIVRSDNTAWRNGAIDRMKMIADPGTFEIGKKSGICVAYDRRIISNLPVSNLDHSVNGLEFTQNGDLLIAVGGSTNMGLPGWKLGSWWESPLSAAVLIAKLSKGASFNGDIKYSSEVPYEAKKLSGDVDVFASGMRNMFGFTMTLKEEFYGSDQGPNCGFGNWATGCDNFNATMATEWTLSSQIDWPPKFKLNTGTCDSGPGRKDKIVQIVQGKFYGHANLQRGVSGECAWIDPLTDSTADGKKAPSNYVSPLNIVPSSVTGVREYGAAHFCSKMRGDLVLSSYNGKRTWRMTVSNGRVIKEPSLLSSTGGIQFVEDIHGNLLFPRLTEKLVNVFVPKVTAPGGLTIIGVWPRRHARSGGSTIYIGGYNFVSSASVSIGGASCPILSGSLSSREVACIMPKYGGGVTLVDVKVTQGAEVSTLPQAVLYTNK